MLTPYISKQSAVLLSTDKKDIRHLAEALRQRSLRSGGIAAEVVPLQEWPAGLPDPVRRCSDWCAVPYVELASAKCFSVYNADQENVTLSLRAHTLITKGYVSCASQIPSAPQQYEVCWPRKDDKDYASLTEWLPRLRWIVTVDSHGIASVSDVDIKSDDKRLQNCKLSLVSKSIRHMECQLHLRNFS